MAEFSLWVGLERTKENHWIHFTLITYCGTAAVRLRTMYYLWTWHKYYYYYNFVRSVQSRVVSDVYEISSCSWIGVTSLSLYSLSLSQRERENRAWRINRLFITLLSSGKNIDLNIEFDIRTSTRTLLHQPLTLTPTRTLPVRPSSRQPKYQLKMELNPPKKWLSSPFLSTAPTVNKPIDWRTMLFLITQPS